MTVEKTVARKSLSVVLALALGVLPGGFAWSAGNVARPVAVAAPVASGVAAMSRVTLNNLALGSLTPLSAAPLAPLPSVTAPAFSGSAPSVMPAAPAAPAVERHPIVGILNDLRARGVQIPETLTASDAPALVALAENLPPGGARQDILSFAQALGRRGGSVDAASASNRMFDGLGKAAGDVVAAAPKTGLAAWVAPLSRLIGRGASAEPAKEAKPSNPADYKVALNELRWVPAAKDIPASTKDMQAVDKQIVGQDEALKAMKFGLKMGVTADGRMEGRHYNMYLSGPEGSGRETALRHLLEDIAPKMQTPDDMVAATNFDHPDKPVILALPAGQGAAFVKAARQFVNQAKIVLPKSLAQGPVAQQKQQIMAGISADFDAALASVKAEAKAVTMPEGYTMEFVFSTDKAGGASFGTRVLYKGKPLAKGAATPRLEEALALLEEKAPVFNEKFTAMVEKNNEMAMAATAQIAKIEKAAAAQILAELGQELMSLVVPQQPASPAMQALQERVNAWRKEFGAKMDAVNVEGFGLIMISGGRIGYTYEGKPITQQKMDEMRASGALTPAKWATIQDELKLRAKSLVAEMNAAMEGFNKEAEALSATPRYAFVDPRGPVAYVQALLNYAAAHYQIFLGGQSGAAEDEDNPLAALMGAGREKPVDPAEHFRLSLLVNNANTKGAPVIWEKNPTFENLFGMADANDRLGMMGMMPVKTEGVGGPTLKPGSYHKANGGFLILNVMDALREPGVWPALMRAVRNGDAEIAEGGLMGMMRGRGVSYSVPTKVKVVLVGSPSMRMMLNHYDEDFGLNFQSVAEFEPRVSIAEGTVAGYAQVIKNIVALGGGEILDFTRDAMSDLLSYAARLADSHKKMTAEFGRLYGVIREASFWAREAGRDEVRGEDVAQALRAKQDREETYRRHLLDIYKQNVFVVQTSGKAVGQVNGLAVMGSFGVPMRVTVRVSRAGGAGGIVSVDRNAGSTGSSFNKALGVVEGFLEGLFAKDKVFPAKLSISYEQNYGGIDGDSATSTEIYGILSALSGVAIGQNFAITGSADQFGNVQAIGGVNEKIEGYFELAKSRGLTGEQGILIPKSNVQDLQLSAEVVEAVAQGKFHIYAVEHVSQGLEILTGVAYSEIIARAEQSLKDMRLAGLKEQMEAKKALGVK